MEYISQLLFRYLRGTLTEQERIELQQWADADPANRQLLERIEDDDTTVTGLKEWYSIPRKALESNERLLALITARESEKKAVRKSLFRTAGWTRYAAAAVMVLAISVLFIYWLGSNKSRPQPSVSTEEISPGGNQAVLVLADGKSINLRADQEELRLGEQGIVYGDGSVVVPYESRSLTVRTPVGGQYKLVLPDGSQVWLNAGSELTYPEHFGTDNRTVSLSGEAYFEVTKGPHGSIFEVHTPQMDVRVLGTQFNVNAYPDLPTTKTTLVEGSVRVDVDGGHSMILKPGEQVYRTAAGLTVDEVNVRAFTAWKDGLFMFDNTPLPDIVRQLSLWYGISVDEEAVPQLHFTGGISRNVPLSQVIDMLENSGKIRLGLEDNQLKVYKY